MRVKGSALRARVEWARRLGPEPFARFAQGLSAPSRALVERGVLVSAWYPFELFVELNQVLDRQHGKGDLALCRELGRFGCEVNLKTLYRLFFKLGSVHFILGRSAAAWRVNYDHGQMTVVSQSEGRALLRVTGVPAPHRAHCLSVLGWISRACELSGGVLVEEIERCVLLGDPACEFEIAWRKG